MEVIDHIEFDDVICDWCGEDYTNSDAVGGLTFGSKACCPVCVPKVEALAKQHNEEQYIGQRAAEGQTFKDFVVHTLRGDEKGSITITSL